MNIREILNGELKALENLLGLLEKQFKLIMKKDVFELEEIVEEIKHGNKDVAQWEVERRKITKGREMSLVIEELKDEEADRILREIKKILHSLKVQKETNELLIKQEISFNHQILNVMNPKREIKTYNSYGALRR
ncbi:MAG: flagellar protein FlgN [Clostridium sp.]|uniref:flagellar protein FlgN n=1 Tax=Clostridium sp. TaxID=1506 RepID=UPI003F380E0F